MLTERKRLNLQRWFIVSHQETFDGTPQYVSADTRGSSWGSVPSWVGSPREARPFNSRQAAHAFLKRLDVTDAHPINLGKYGFFA
jgi:hypothetical protein